LLELVIGGCVGMGLGAWIAWLIWGAGAPDHPRPTDAQWDEYMKLWERKWLEKHDITRES
jgi:hypothetical protein